MELLLLSFAKEVRVMLGTREVADEIIVVVVVVSVNVLVVVVEGDELFG